MIYLVLFWTFLKVGAFTFGGGYAMLPLIEDEVISHGWLTEQEIVNFIAVSESTPGPFAVNISTYVGMQAGGLFGAFCAAKRCPSFVRPTSGSGWRGTRTNALILTVCSPLRTRRRSLSRRRPPAQRSQNPPPCSLRTL